MDWDGVEKGDQSSPCSFHPRLFFSAPAIRVCTFQRLASQFDLIQYIPSSSTTVQRSPPLRLSTYIPIIPPSRAGSGHLALFLLPVPLPLRFPSRFPLRRRLCGSSDFVPWWKFLARVLLRFPPRCRVVWQFAVGLGWVGVG